MFETSSIAEKWNTDPSRSEPGQNESIARDLRRDSFSLDLRGFAQHRGSSKYEPNDKTILLETHL